MPCIHIEKPEVFYNYHIGRCHKGQSRIWDNRISDFPELNGDFSWREKPINEAAMKKPVIDESVMLRHKQYHAAKQALESFKYFKTDFNTFKQTIQNI
jgi:hypothetical protein